MILRRDPGKKPFLFPCSPFARSFRALHYGGPFLTALRGIPWEDVQ